MAVCNVERFLGQAIESILTQSFADFELVIVDYGSTDRSKSIIVSYASQDQRIKLSEVPSCVLPAARNAACSLAQGKYIAIMDADDVCLPDRLELEVDFMEQHPDVGLIGGGVVWVDAADRKLGYHSHPSSDTELRFALADHCCFWHPTVLFRKDAFMSVGGYRVAFVAAHDYDLELRISDRYKCANLQQAVLNYRIHPEQLSMRKRTQQTLGILAAQRSALMRQKGQEDVIDAVDVITPELLVHVGIDQSTYENALLSESRRWIRHMTSAGETTVALEAALDVLRGHWLNAEEWQIADLHLLAASLRWRRHQFSQSALSFVKALLMRPKILGRPLRPWLQRIGVVHG